MSISKGVFRSEIMRATSALAVSAAMALAPLAPLTAATVLWVPDADGFWDLAGNWNLGLPVAGDDVIISVGGAVVRTITFRTGTVAVNSLASDEDLLVTGGELIVNNAYTNTQATRLQNGVLRLNGASSLASFTHSAGTLAGTGTVTISGAATLTGGSQTGAGTTIIQGATSFGSGYNLSDGRVIELRGGATTGTSFSINLDNSGSAGFGTLRNASGSTFVDSSSTSGSFTTFTNLGLFENAGTYQKTGAGTTTFSVGFTNSGTLDIQNGTVSLTDNSTQSGSISLANGAVLRFGGGTHAIDGAGFTGAAGSIVRVASGEVTFSSATTLSNVELQNGTFRLNGTTGIAAFTHSAGSLAGTGTVTISGAAALTGGAQGGAGTTIIQGATSFGSGYNLNDGRVLELRGGATTGTSFSINLDNSGAAGFGTLRNATGSTFVDSTTGSSSFTTFTSTGLFENAGTYQKTGAGTTTFSTGFTNSGTLDIQNGTISLTDNSTQSGSISLANGAVLRFGGGTHAINGAGFTGAAGSIVRVASGDVTFSNTTTFANVELQNGTLRLNGTTGIAAFTHSAGTLAGSGTVTISGAAALTGGAQGGAGTTIIQGATSFGSGYSLNDGRLLELRGGASTATAFTINLDNSGAAGFGTLRNAAGSTFADSTTTNSSFTTFTSTGLFENAGTYQKTGAGTTTITVSTTNSGTLDIQSGTLAFNDTSTQAGSVVLADGAVLRFSGGAHLINGASFTGAAGGTVQITNGTVTFAAPTAITGPTLSHTGGVLNGAGTITVSGAASFTGGTQTGAGTTIIQGATSFGASYNLSDDRVLELRGGATTATAFTINLDSGGAAGFGTLRNAVGSTFVDSTATTSNFSTNSSPSLFDNLGTYRKSGAGTTSFGTGFDNSGTLDIQSGTVSFNENSTQSGSITLANGAVLRFGGGTHAINGAGITAAAGSIVRVSAGDAAFSNTTTLANAELQNGTFRLNGTTGIAAFTHTAGTLAGTGTVTISGAATLSGGTQTGTGTTIITGATSFGSNYALADGRVLELRGGATTATAFTFNLDVSGFAGFGTLRNAAGSTFADSTATNSTFNTNSSPVLFENAGTYQKTGAGTTNFTSGVEFTNNGTLDIQNGTISLSGPSTQAGGVVLANGAILSFDGGTHQINGASFTGAAGGILRIASGTVTFAVPTSISGPTLAQTGGFLNGPGTVTVSGAANFTGGTQTGAGTTIIEGVTSFGSSYNLSDGRVLELRGGATTGSSFTINLDNSGSAGFGTLRNAVGSTFADSTTGSGNFTTFSSPSLFENLGTYLKTGAGTTTFSVGLTNSGTLDIQNGTISLIGPSTQAGGVVLANGAILSFDGSTHQIDGASFTGAAGGLLRIASGTVTFAVPTSISGPTFAQTGGILNGAGTITVSGAANFTGGTQTGAGTTIIEGVTSFGTSYNLSDGRVLELRGGATTGSFFTINLDNSGSAGFGTLRNAASSTIVDSTTSSGNFTTFSSPSLFENLGTYLKTGAGTTILSVGFTNSGTVQVDAGLFRMAQAVTGASGTTLTGGTWIVNGSAGGSTIDFETATGLTSLVTNAADLRLAGVNSNITSGAGNAGIEATLTTNADAGALRIGSGRSYVATAGGGAFSNAGLLDLSGGSFGATSLSNSGTVQGFGSVTVAISNTGTVRAAGGTLATRAITGSGAIVVDAAATLDASAAAADLSAGSLTHNGASLNLGTRNILISNDYQNAAFGSGNSFNARANVAGTGLINAVSATQDLSATGLTGNTLNVGNIRIGGSTQIALTITNNGTATTLRGAVQNGNAPGVSLANADFVAGPNGGSAVTTISFTSGTAGSLAGQSINVVNNFDNVADATINLAGAAFNRAVGSVTPTPLNLGNVRVGSTASGAVTIANTAPAGAFSEGLRVTGADTSGDAGVSGVPTGIIAAGSSAGATVSISTAAAGARSGTVNFNLATNGTGTSGLAEEAIAGGSVAVSANVFALANAGVTPSLNFGNVRVGTTANRTVTVTNAALGGVPLGFQEGLDASIGSTPAGYSGSGSVTNLAVGGEGSLTITLDTATAGARNGQAVIALASNGTGTSGLANQALPDANVALTGAVFNRAVGSVTPTPVNLGNFRIGSTASGAVTIANTAPAGAFSEGLRVTGTGTTGDAGVSGVTASVIAAGGSGGATVSVATGTAGAKSGTVNFNFATNGTGTSGLAEEAIAGGSVTVNADVFALANAGVTPSLNFGNVRVGATASRTVTVTNAAIGGVPLGFQEGLDASIGSTPAGFSGSGSITNLAADGSGALTINLDTATAGVRSGQAVIALASNGTGTSGLGTLALPDANVALSGAVFNRAVGSVTPTPVNLGNFRIGSTASGAVTIANTAPAGAFSEGLRVTGTGTTGDAGVSGVPAGVIAAGGSGGATVSVDTSSAGAKSGSVNFSFATNGTGTSGLAEEAIAGGSVTVNANVFALANPIISGLLQFGNVQQGSTQIRSITVENRLLAGVLAQFQEGLNANFGSVTGDVQSVAGSILNLGAGASDTSTLTVRLNTATAGAKSGSVEILLQSNGTGTSGLGNLDLPSQNVTVLGQVDTQGSVFRLAQATLDPTSVAFGSRRVGDVAPTQVLTITNSALNDGFSERLDASVGATTGRATGSGGPVSLLAAGASSTDISVSIDTSVAGANGSVTINFASNGAGTSGAGITPLASQVVTLGGAVFQAAIAGSQPAEITLASRRIGDAAATANLTIINTAPGTGGFTESLSATATGNNGFTVNGAGQATTGDLGVGGSEGLTIARGTGAAGAFTGSISIANTSLAAAGSGLSNLTLASQSVTVNSSVFQAAIAGSQPAEITLASRRVGDAAATAVLTISNVAPGTGGFTESLSATASGNNGVTVNGGGQASTGALGVGGSQELTIARGTGTAGSFTGAVSIANTSLAIAGSGLSDLALASQTVTVNSAVYQAAIAGSQPASITLAARRVGDAAATANLTISNIAPGTGGFTEALSATAIGSNGVTVNGAGQASTGALGVGGSQGLTIARGTGTAGSSTGAVSIANTSLAIAGSGLSDLELAGQSVTVNSNVYAAAVAQLATTTVDFGTVRQGASAPVVNVGISNAAVGALADSLATSIGATPAGVTANGPGQVAAGASGDASFTLSTATAGVISGNTSLGFTSVNPEMADLTLASQQVSFTGTVTQLALAQLFKAGGQGSFSGSGSAYTLDFGSLSAGNGTISADLGILNGNSGSAFAETLGGSFVLAPATGFGFNGSSFAGLIGGGSRTGNLLSLDFSGLSAGFYSTTLTFNGFSRFDGLADQSLDPITLTVRTRITATGAVPEPAVWAQMLFGFGLVGSFVRRRRARTEREYQCRT
jgi:formylmethanofuran dehydrogenase subunit C